MIKVDSDYKKRQQSSAGQEAKALLENKMLVNAFDMIRKEIFDSWSRSLGPEKDLREAAYHMQRAVDSLQLNIGAIVTTGKFAETQLLSFMKEKV